MKNPLAGNKRISGLIGLVIFTLGIITGLIFYGLAVWADLEASLFAPPGDGSGQLGTLTCPLMITTREMGIIQASFHNPTAGAVRVALRVTITEGAVIFTRQIEDAFRLQPGETQARQWEVKPEDAAWGRFVFFRLFAFQYPMPSKTGSCGVLVANLTAFTGAQVTAFLMVISTALMIGGMAVWVNSNRPIIGRKLAISRALVMLLIAVLLGLISSLAGWWMVGAGLILITMLMVVVIVANFIQSA